MNFAVIIVVRKHIIAFLFLCVKDLKLYLTGGFKV